jgi:signal transduction histidine kinase/ActR/RegA family two-component response regulator
VPEVKANVAAHCNDEQRLAALRRYGILDTEPEAAFDDITRLVAHVCQTPMATVTFIDAGRQWFKSEVGMGVRETPLDRSICAHTLLEPELLVVGDTLEDERFRSFANMVGEPGLRFYAGARLDSPDGQPLGTLCVLDVVPRTLTPQQLDALRALSRQVMTQLELRRSLAAQVAAAEALNAARLEAERANRTKDQFLATLSHELRTPLSSILLWASTLHGRQVDPKQLEEGLSTILVSARAQKKLIEELLDTSRIAAGKISLHPRDVDVVALARQTVEGVRAAATEKGVAVETGVPPGGLTVSGDEDRLRQVLWNLLSNAIQFTPPGGRVHVRLAERDGAVELTVCDTGEGISAEFLPFVFDPFRQADASSTRRHGGLGLGLAIAQQIVQLHAGTIRAESPGPGLGATFTVRLPVSTGRDTHALHTGTASAGRVRRGGVPLANTRVLLVEDDAATRAALVATFTNAGATVTAVASASEAIDAFRRERPDVLLSDVGLPDTDGYALVRTLRRLEAAGGRHTPALAITAYAGDDSHRRAVEAGFDTHLPKPADADELLEVVTHLVRREAPDV